MKIIITDKEFFENKKTLLPFKEHIASMAGFIDEKAGFITKLEKYSYSPLTLSHTFVVKKFKDN